MRTLFLFFLLPFFVGCCNKSVEQSLDKALKLMSRNPDSTNLILSQINENKLRGEEQNKFYFIKIDYHLNKKAPIATIDSLLSILLAYSKERNVQEQFQITNFARYVFEVTDRKDSALYYSHKAYDLAVTHPELKESIVKIQRITARILQKNGMNDQALDLFHSLSNIKDSIFQIENQGYSPYADLAYYYKRLQNYDSCVFYFRKTIYSLDSSDKSIPFYHYELSDIYLLQHNYKAALEEATKAMQTRTRRLDVPFFTFAKAKVFFAIAEYDSTRYYLTRTIQTPDPIVATAAYAYLAELEQKENNWDKAYNALMSYQDQLDNVGGSIETEILKQQFQEERMKNEIMKLKIKEQDKNLYLLILLIILMILSLAFYFFYTRFQKKKALTERLHAEEQLKNIASLAQKEYELALLNEKSAELRAILFKKLSIAQKLPSPREEDREGGKKIILSQEDWQELIETINLLYSGFITRLSESFPELTKSDLEFCCLIKIKICLQDLSDIYCVSKAAITKRKTRLKNLKLDLLNSNITLDEFIDRF